MCLTEYDEAKAVELLKEECCEEERFNIGRECQRADRFRKEVEELCAISRPRLTKELPMRISNASLREFCFIRLAVIIIPIRQAEKAGHF